MGYICLDVMVAVRHYRGMTIRDRLAQMTHRQAAELVGVSRPFVSQIARGSRKPSIDTVAALSAKLGLDDAEIGASVCEFCPEAFPVGAPSDSQAA